MRILTSLCDLLEREALVVLVSVLRVEGSAPREPGARMLVRASGDVQGTIGGGSLEWEALRLARDMLAHRTSAKVDHDFALGPELAQCCGGRVTLRFELCTQDDLPRLRDQAEAERKASDATRLALFGNGHVGRALVLALAPLPFEVAWIDERAELFPAAVPGNVTKIAPLEPAAELDALAPGTFILVMTHSHPLDLAITARALSLGRFPFVGLIGSDTKRARFHKRLSEGGLTEAQIARLVCPIGLPDIEGKEPAVIAASTAASLLIAREHALAL